MQGWAIAYMYGGDKSTYTGSSMSCVGMYYDDKDKTAIPYTCLRTACDRQINLGYGIFLVAFVLSLSRLRQRREGNGRLLSRLGPSSDGPRRFRRPNSGVVQRMIFRLKPHAHFPASSSSFFLPLSSLPAAGPWPVVCCALIRLSLRPWRRRSQARHAWALSFQPAESARIL
jgi:hypothetical protein